MLTIVLDIGSSFVKSAVADTTTGELVDHRHSPTPPSVSPHPDRYELEPYEVLALVEFHLHQHLAKHRDVSSLLLSTQMRGFVVTDPQGRPRTGMITWQDRRAQEPRPAATLAAWAAEIGTPVAGEFHTLGGWVVRQLTGAHATHLSNAAATGLWRADGWDLAELAAIGAAGLRLPSVLPGPVGTWHSATHEPAIAVWADIGDHQAAVLGTGAGVDDIVISLGTAGLASRIVSPGPHHTPGTGELRPHVDGSWLHTVSGLPGGRRVQQWIDQHPRPERVAAWAGIGTDFPDDLLTAFTAAYRRPLAALAGPDQPDVPAQLHLTGRLATAIPRLADGLAALLPHRTVITHGGEPTLAGLARLAAVRSEESP